MTAELLRSAAATFQQQLFSAAVAAAAAASSNLSSTQRNGVESPPTVVTSDAVLINNNMSSATCQTPPSFAPPPDAALNLQITPEVAPTQFQSPPVTTTVAALQSPIEAAAPSFQLMTKVAPFVLAALCGFQTVPIRLKIVFDQIFRAMSSSCVEVVLAKAGWSPEDFARGYILPIDPQHQKAASVWQCVSLHTELAILQAIAQVFPTHASMALSLRNTAIQSLLCTAALAQKTASMDAQHQQRSLLHVATTTASVPQLMVALPTAFISSPPSSNQNFTAISPQCGGGNKMEWTTSSVVAVKSESPVTLLHTTTNIATTLATTTENATIVDLSTSKQHSYDPCQEDIQRRTPETFSPKKSASFEAQQHFSTAENWHLDKPISLPTSHSASSHSASSQDHRPSRHLPFSAGSQRRKAAGARALTLANRKAIDFGIRKSMKNSKRRVQCPICMKTYCDKGALKIHNSAVHLKETHYCTVAGCDRMFSSRRSRNRHSGNLNMHASQLMKQGASASTSPTLTPSATNKFISDSVISQSHSSRSSSDAENGGGLRRCVLPEDCVTRSSDSVPPAKTPPPAPFSLLAQLQPIGFRLLGQTLLTAEQNKEMNPSQNKVPSLRKHRKYTRSQSQHVAHLPSTDETKPAIDAQTPFEVNEFSTVENNIAMSFPLMKLPEDVLEFKPESQPHVEC